MPKEFCSGHITVKDLKAILKKLPDELPIYLTSHPNDFSVETCFPISFVRNGVSHNIIAIILWLTPFLISHTIFLRLALLIELC